MALGTPTVYDPRNNVVTYNGVLVTGFADGDSITIAADADAVSSQQGADGEIVINAGPTKPSTVTLRLMSTSSSVPYLTGEALIQHQRGATATAFGPLSVINSASGQVTSFAQAWFKRVPDQSMGVEAGVVEFVLGGVPVITPGTVA